MEKEKQKTEDQKNEKEERIQRYCEAYWRDFIDNMDVLREAWGAAPNFPETKDDYYYALNLHDEDREHGEFFYGWEIDHEIEGKAYDYAKEQIEEMFYKKAVESGVFNNPPYLVR